MRRLSLIAPATALDTGTFVDSVARARFTGAPSSPGAARHWTNAQLRARRPSIPGTVIDDAELIVSELVTNSGRAGSAAIDLTLHCTATTVRIGVADTAPGRPLLVHATDTDNHGRGLAIVSSIAARWGVQNTDDGKEVWAIVGVPDQG